MTTGNRHGPRQPLPQPDFRQPRADVSESGFGLRAQGADDSDESAYELAGLVVAIRRYILDTPTDTWERSVIQAAQAVTAALSGRIADEKSRIPPCTEPRFDRDVDPDPDPG